jgi:hypothetical protein
MPWAVPPSTRLFWLDSSTLRTIDSNNIHQQCSWDTASSDIAAIRFSQKGQQKIIKHDASTYPTERHNSASFSVAGSLTFADMVDVRELASGGEHSSSWDGFDNISVTSRVSFADIVNVKEIPKNRTAFKRSCFYSSQDIAIFELEAFLLALDSSGVENEDPVDCGHQEEHKDDYEEPRVTGAIRDVSFSPRDPAVITKPDTIRSSPLSPNPRIFFSPRLKRVTRTREANLSEFFSPRLKRVTRTREANVSDKLRQMFLPFGATEVAEEKEETNNKAPEADDIEGTGKVNEGHEAVDLQNKGGLISCLATSASSKKSSDTKKVSKEVSFCQVYFCNTVQVSSIPQIPEFYKKRLFYSYADLASFEIGALMEQQQGDACSTFPMPSEQDHCTTTSPRVSFCQDDPQVIIIPKIQDAELGYYFYRNGDIAQFRHDAWMEERIFGHPLTSFGCDSKG